MIVAGVLCVRPVPYLGWLTLKGRSGFQWFLRAVYLLPLLGGLGVGLIVVGGTGIHENLPDSWKPFVAISGFLLGVSVYLLEKKTTVFSAVSNGYKVAIYSGLAIAFLVTVGGLPEETEEVSGCKADISCWGKLHRISAEVRCEDRIEQLAKYEYDWNVGFGETTFSTWSWGGNDKNVVRYWGDKIKFQNIFGTYQTHTYTCLYDPKAEEVIGVNAAPGDLASHLN